MKLTLHDNKELVLVILKVLILLHLSVIIVVYI